MDFQKIVSKAPTRIDIGGGTLDLWPIHQLLDHRVTVNFGIDLWAQCTISKSSSPQFVIRSRDQKAEVSGSWTKVMAEEAKMILPLRLLRHFWRDGDLPIEMELSAMSPVGAGLGGSSALAIAIVQALCAARHKWFGEEMLDEVRMVAIAQDIEARIIHAPTGVQDYWGAVRGGINILRFPPGGVSVETLSTEVLAGLEAHLIVCYSGQARASSLNNWQIFRRVFDRDGDLLKKLGNIGLCAEELASAVIHGDVANILKISKEEWLLRTQLWPDIETEITKKLDAAACGAGAMFSRVCGAGGGGVMAVFAKPSVRQSVTDALTRAGGTVLNAHIAKKGMTIEY
jgi:D-glycero-alpha-D-manno-heptose-7-phosphate kinase